MLGILLAAPQIQALLFSKTALPPGQVSFAYELAPFPRDRQLALLLNFKLLKYHIQRDLLILALAGFFLAFRKPAKYQIPLWALLGLVIFMLCRGLLYFPVHLRMFDALIHFADRFQYLLQGLYLLLAMLTLDELLSFALAGSHRPAVLRAGVSVLLLWMLWVGFRFANLEIQNMHHSEKFKTLMTYEDKSELLNLWDWLSQNVDARQTRVYFESTFFTYKWSNEFPEPSIWNRKTHVLALTSYYTPLRQVGGYCGFTSSFAQNYNRGVGGFLFGEFEPPGLPQDQGIDKMRALGILAGNHAALRLTPEIISQKMQYLNTQYLIANSPGVKRYLDRIEFLQPVQTIGRFKIYQNVRLTPAWAFKLKDRQAIACEKRSSNHYVLQADGQQGEAVLLSLAYHPRWKAYF
ncbi:MAG: hypothetical protein D6814_10850, partial [Calditrichaeota bacterium]